MNDNEYDYTEELKQLLNDHSSGLTLREIHNLAHNYNIPSEYTPKYTIWAPIYSYECGDFWYSTEVALALAHLIQDKLIRRHNDKFYLK